MTSDNRAERNLLLPSRARHFRVKAFEFLQRADNAQYRETKRIYTNLAHTYEQLAVHAESIERHHASLERRKKSD